MYKIKILIILISLSSIGIGQNKRISISTRSSSTEFKSATTGETVSRTSSSSIVWTMEGESTKVLKRPNCKGIGVYLSTDNEANIEFELAKKQFKLGMIGSGVMWGGYGMAVFGLGRKMIKMVNDTNTGSDVLVADPIFITGMSISFAAGIYALILKNKGYRSLIRSADIYNKNLESDQGSIFRPSFDLKLGYGFGTPMFGFCLNI